MKNFCAIFENYNNINFIFFGVKKDFRYVFRNIVFIYFLAVFSLDVEIFMIFYEYRGILFEEREITKLIGFFFENEKTKRNSKIS